MACQDEELDPGLISVVDAYMETIYSFSNHTRMYYIWGGIDLVMLSKISFTIKIFAYSKHQGGGGSMFQTSLPSS